MKAIGKDASEDSIHLFSLAMQSAGRLGDAAVGAPGWRLDHNLLPVQHPVGDCHKDNEGELQIIDPFSLRVTKGSSYAVRQRTLSVHVVWRDSD